MENVIYVMISIYLATSVYIANHQSAFVIMINQIIRPESQPHIWSFSIVLHSFALYLLCQPTVSFGRFKLIRHHVSIHVSPNIDPR